MKSAQNRVEKYNQDSIKILVFQPFQFKEREKTNSGYTRCFIDNSYLVGGIVKSELNHCPVQKITWSRIALLSKRVISCFEAELQLSPLFFVCCFLYEKSRFSFLDSWPKHPQLSFFLSQGVHLAISQPPPRFILSFPSLRMLQYSS